MTKGIKITNMVVKSSGDTLVATTDKKVKRVSSNGHVTDIIETTPFSLDGICLTETDEISVVL